MSENWKVALEGIGDGGVRISVRGVKGMGVAVPGLEDPEEVQITLRTEGDVLKAFKRYLPLLQKAYGLSEPDQD